MNVSPPKRLILAAGDTVNINFDQPLAIVAHGTAEKPVTVNFAPGRYDLFPTHCQRRRYHISNNNDAPEQDKVCGILIEDSRHLRITGAGARLVCRGKMIECCIDRSEHVTVTGLEFDYHRPTVSEFTVVDATETHADLAIHQDSAYRVEQGRIVWVGEGWSYATGLAQELIPETDEIWRRRDPLAGMTIEELAPCRVRARGRHDMVMGRVFQLRETVRDCVGVFIHRSRDVEFREVKVRFAHGMGIVGQSSENITLDRVQIAPDPASGRTSACWADCTHFSGCRGKITVKDCVFNGAHDDAMNVHGTYLKIVAVENDREIKVRFMHRQTYGFQAFQAGDEIEFVRGETLATFAVNRVAGVEMVGDWEQVLRLEGPVPADWREGDVVENVTWTPAVEVTGCRVSRIPTRGFLITTRRPVVVAGNELVALRIGIHVEGDARKWYESGCVRDMVIRGNRFVRLKGEAICIRPPDATVHWNIRMEDNVVIDREIT
jgi:hypothetical protein